MQLGRHGFWDSTRPAFRETGSFFWNGLVLGIVVWPQDTRTHDPVSVYTAQTWRQAHGPSGCWGMHNVYMCSLQSALSLRHSCPLGQCGQGLPRPLSPLSEKKWVSTLCSDAEAGCVVRARPHMALLPVCDVGPLSTSLLFSFAFSYWEKEEAMVFAIPSCHLCSPPGC